MSALVILFLSGSLIDSCFNLTESKFQLFGYSKPVEDTLLSINTWFDRSFQDKKNDYINNNFGGRNFLVRLNNQVNYTFYDKINVWDVFKGKDDYLFSEAFFKNFSGEDYKGNHFVDSIHLRLVKLNSWLKDRGSKLICKSSA